MDNIKKNNESADQGIFIAFEGIDGSGKSTQITILNERMKEEGIHCYTTMEPTDSPFGSLIHQIMTGRIKTDNKVIAALFVALSIKSMKVQRCSQTVIIFLHMHITVLICLWNG